MMHLITEPTTYGVCGWQFIDSSVLLPFKYTLMALSPPDCPFQFRDAVAEGTHKAAPYTFKLNTHTMDLHTTKQNGHCKLPPAGKTFT